MADSSFRSFRRDAPTRESEPPQRDGLSDPLAELARLIGQGGGQDVGHQPSGSYDEAAPPASEFDWASVNENDGYAANRRENGYDDRSQEAASWPLDEGYENEQAPPGRSFPPALGGARGESGPSARSYNGPAGHAPAQSRAQPFPFIPPAPANSYQADNSAQRSGGYASSYDGDYADDDYDDEAERPRRGGKIIAAVLGLAVLGTAGALGYRAINGSSVLPAFPPIIKPADGPVRMRPDQQAQAPNSGQADSGKGAGEQVVSNQEQPVDVQSGNPIPRMIKTIPVVPNGSPDPALTGGQPPAAVAQTPVPPPGYAEPVPAQPFGAGQAAVPQVPTVNRPARVPTAPVQQASPAAGGPTASVARPVPVARPKTVPKPTTVAERPSAGGPLSLVPQQEGVTPPPPAPTRAVHTATAAPVTSSAREGAAPAAGVGYVQVSSQRSEAEAQAAYRELQTKFPQQLGSRHAVIRRADLGDKGVYYRALVGPFASGEQATAFCSNLKAAGGSCFTQRN